MATERKETPETRAKARSNRKGLGYGAIALCGLPRSGKTAYLIALDVSTGNRDRLSDWDLVKRSELTMYVAALGEQVGGTGRRALERSVVKAFDFIEMYRGYRRALLPLPRFLRQHYRIAIPDVAGEAFSYVSSYEMAETDGDKKLEQTMLAELVGCRSLIFLVDLRPREDSATDSARSATDAATRRAAQQHETLRQVRAFQTTVRRVLERRSRSKPLIVALLLTKCDLLEPHERRIKLPVETCARWRYFAERAGLDPLQAGLEAHDNGTVSYSLDAIDAAATPDPNDPLRKHKEFWANDPAHNDAVARDWLRCHLPHAADLIDEVSQQRHLDLELVIGSSWGHKPVPTVVGPDGRSVEVVPESPSEIAPVRLLAPIRSVLDRLHAVRTRHTLTRRVLAASALTVALLAAWPGHLYWRTVQAGSLLAAGDRDGALARVQSVEDHPLRGISPQSWLADAAAICYRISVECDADSRATDDPAKIESARMAALEAARRAVDLDRSPKHVNWHAGLLETRIRTELASATRTALATLRDSEGTLPVAIGMPLARDVLAANLEPVRRRTDVILGSVALHSEEAATLRQELDAIVDAGRRLARPGFFFEKTTEPASLRPQIARALLTQSLLGVVALRADAATSDAIPDADRRARIFGVLSQSIEAVRFIATEPDDPAHAEAGDNVLAVFAALLALPDIAPTAERAATDPHRELDRIALIRDLDGKVRAGNVPERVRAACTARTADVVEDFVESTWTALDGRIEKAATGSPGDCNGLIAALEGMDENGRRNHGPALAVARLVMKVRELNRALRNNTIPPLAEYETALRTALETIAAEQPEKARDHRETDLRNRLRRSLDDLRLSLIQAHDFDTGDQHQVWFELAKLLAIPGSKLERIVGDDRLYKTFAQANVDPTEPVPDDLRNAIAAMFADTTRHEDERASVLGNIGGRLANNRATLSAAFAFRRGLEWCLRERKASPAEIADIAGRFRAHLLHPEPKHHASRADMVGLVGGLLDDVVRDGKVRNAAPDLGYLFGVMMSANAPSYALDLIARVSGLVAVEMKNESDRPLYETAVLAPLADRAVHLLGGGGKSAIDVDGMRAWLGTHARLLAMAEQAAQRSPSSRRLTVLATIGRILLAEDKAVDANGGATAPAANATVLRAEVTKLLGGSSPLLTDPKDPAVGILSAVGQHLAKSPSTVQRAWTLRQLLGTERRSRADATIAETLRAGLSVSALMPATTSLGDDVAGRLIDDFLGDLGENATDRAALADLFALRASKEVAPGLRNRLVAIARRISDLFPDQSEREGLFADEVQNLRTRLAGAAPDKQAVLVAQLYGNQATGGILSSQRLAEAAKAPATAAMLAAVSRRLDLLSKLEVIWVRVNDTTPFYITADEVSISTYSTLLQTDASLDIEFEAETSYRFAKSATRNATEMNAAYQNQSTDRATHRVVSDQAVFGVDPVAVEAFLRKHTARLPTRDEWLFCLSRLDLDSVIVQNTVSARTPKQLEALRDKNKDGLRGLRFGVREWVSSGNGFAVYGGSWLSSRSPQSASSDDTSIGRLDIGFRIAADPLPPEFQRKGPEVQPK